MKNYTKRRLEYFDEIFPNFNGGKRAIRKLVKEFIATSIHQAEQEMLKRVVGEIERMNNFRQAKADGKDEWNNALEQSACKVDALLSSLSLLDK